MIASLQYRALLLEYPLLEESPGVEVMIDARDFDHANELAEKMADSIGYTVEQVSEAGAAGAQSMSDAMQQGGKAVGIRRLVQEADESGNPEEYWKGFYLSMTGAMAAHIGHSGAMRVIDEVSHITALHKFGQERGL